METIGIVGIILGLYEGYIGIMEKKMENYYSGFRLIFLTGAFQGSFPLSLYNPYITPIPVFQARPTTHSMHLQRL